MIEAKNANFDNLDRILSSAEVGDYVRISYFDEDNENSTFGGVVVGKDRSEGAWSLYGLKLEDPYFDIEFEIVGTLSELGTAFIESALGDNDNIYRPELDDFYLPEWVTRSNHFIELGTVGKGGNVLIAQVQTQSESGPIPLPPSILYRVNDVAIDREFSFDYDHED